MGTKAASILGLVTGSILTAAVVVGVQMASAASGDLSRKVTFEQDLTGPQAACFATCLVNSGAWSGSVGDVRIVRLERRGNGTPFVSGEGVEYVAPSSVAALIQSEGPQCFDGSAP